MRCTNCGLPLSPANTSGTCPRCHTLIGSSSGYTPAASATPPSSPSMYEQQWEMGMGASAGAWPEMGTGMGQPHLQGNVEYMPWPSDTPSPAPLFQQPFQPAQPISLPGQFWSPAQGSLQTPAPAPVQTPMPTRNWMPPASDPRNAPVRLRENKRGGQLGFTIAGLCVITGALILIFVYIVAMGLPPNGTYANTVTPGVVQRTATPQPTVAPSPTLAPSPTAALPGQQYVSNGQMASAIDQTSARPITVATTFQVGQRVYITFNLHPEGHTGAVCLLWYQNGKFSSQFEFGVSSINTTAYSYTYYHSTGPAYVELYWASSTACTDKQLAQRITFTITS
jgi:hypothetical protein